MDEISIQACETGGRAVLINGRDILELVRAGERSTTSVLGKTALKRQARAGYMVSMSKRSHLDIPIWRGGPTQCEIACCDCGVSGCANATMTIEVLDEIVMWREFALNNRPIAVGPFEFTRSQYEAVLKYY